MDRQLHIFPEVTMSPEVFINHIKNLCNKERIDKDVEEEWINHIKSCNSAGYYFLNLIYIKHISFWLLVHEMVHHVAQQLRTIISFNFNIIDDINDGFWIIIYNKQNPLHILSHNNK